MIREMEIETTKLYMKKAMADVANRTGAVHLIRGDNKTGQWLMDDHYDKHGPEDEEDRHRIFKPNMVLEFNWAQWNKGNTDDDENWRWLPLIARFTDTKQTRGGPVAMYITIKPGTGKPWVDQGCLYTARFTIKSVYDYFPTIKDLMFWLIQTGAGSGLTNSVVWADFCLDTSHPHLWAREHIGWDGVRKISDRPDWRDQHVRGGTRSGNTLVEYYDKKTEIKNRREKMRKKGKWPLPKELERLVPVQRRLSYEQAILEQEHATRFKQRWSGEMLTKVLGLHSSEPPGKDSKKPRAMSHEEMAQLGQRDDVNLFRRVKELELIDATSTRSEKKKLQRYQDLIEQRGMYALYEKLDKEARRKWLRENEEFSQKLGRRCRANLRTYFGVE